MNEGPWIKTRIAPAANSAVFHPLADTTSETDWGEVDWAEVEGREICVRSVVPPRYVIEMFRSVGCNSERFFEAHPKDSLLGDTPCAAIK